MKFQYIYIAILFLVILSSCGEETLPEPQSNDPVFTISGRLNGEGKNFIAGENEVYLYTEFSKDTFDVFTLTGRFGKVPNCNTNCTEELRFHIRDMNRTLGNEPFSIETALQEGTYDYKGSETNPDTTYIYNVFLNNKSISSGGESEIWTVYFPADTFVSPNFPPQLNGLPSSDIEVELSYALNPSNLATCNSYRRKISFPNNVCSGALALMDPGSFGTNGGGIRVAETNGITSYNWSDGSTADTIAILNGTECVSIICDNGEMDTVCIDVVEVSPNVTNYCSLAFDYEINREIDEVIPGEMDPLGLGQVIIEYIDEFGTFYSTELGPQSENDLFEYFTIEDFENNENDELTKKLNVQFSCTLYNIEGEPIRYEAGTGSIGVAYPK